MRTFLFLAVALSICSVATWSQSRLDGQISEANGTPTRVGHIVILNPSNPKALHQASVDADGRFSLVVDSSGVFLMRLSAVNDEPCEAILYVVKGKAIHIEARLAPNTCSDSIGSIRVIGSFNHYSFDSAISMKREVDGTFGLELQTDSSKLTYQLLGTVPGSRSINGQKSDAYELDPGGDYRSVVYPQGGKVTLHFDPHIAPHAGNPARIEIHSADPQLDEITDIFRLRQSILSNFKAQRDSVERVGRSVMLFKDDYDWYGALSPLRARLNVETNPLCRQALLISFFSSGSIRTKDSVLARQLLEEVPPESRFWSIGPSMTIARVRASLAAKVVEHYTAEVIDRNPDREVRAAFLAEALLVAKFEGVGKARAQHYFELLTTQYSGSTWAEFAKKGLSPSKRVRVGERLPQFKFRDLRDSTRYLTNPSFKGKILLLDFWATWCKPCVAEIPGIHRVYDKYHRLGLEILSVSFDNTVADLLRFFQTRDSMTWLQVFAPIPERASLMDTFEFIGIPRPLLVDKEGKIIAMDSELSREKLEDSLRKVFAVSKH